MDKDLLYEVDSKFREKIESYCKALHSELPHGLTLLSVFPRGCCHDTSLLLARYLREHGFQSHITLNNEHAWLQVGNYYVDITANQFGEGFSSVVIVTLNDRDYRTISSRSAKRYLDSDYRKLEAFLVESFDSVYEEIMCDPLSAIS